MGRDLTAETSGAVTKMLDCGVEYGDVRPPNVLWNREIGNVILVDFERSEIIKPTTVLQDTSPNHKQKDLHNAKERPLSRAACRDFHGLASYEL